MFSVADSRNKHGGRGDDGPMSSAQAVECSELS